MTEAKQRIEEARRLRSDTLDLGDLGLAELPAELGDLPHLRRLFLGRNRPTADGGAELDGGRPSSQVRDLAPLSGLSCLQSLHLWGTRVTDLAPLSGLSGLQSLDLRGTAVTELAPLSGLSCLQSLDLRGTWVTDVGPLSCLSGLQSLNLGGTDVTDLTPLSHLHDLRSLDFFDWRNEVSASTLRMISDLPRLTELIAGQATTVPREVLSGKPHDNCLPRLRAYFAELDLGAETENEVKVILLGNGRVGKTQLCRRFRGEPFDETIESTHGVQLWRERLRIGGGDGGEWHVLQVNWWDFGGQDIYHGTHALFLTSRALFLVLWTPALDNHEEDPAAEVPTRNQPLAYWLDFVRTLAGNGSPLIVVQSQCDTFACRRPDPPRPEGAGFFECCFHSARTGLGHEALASTLRQAHLYLQERTGPLLIGRGRAEVRRRLYAWRTSDQKRPAERRRHRTLTLDEFRALCDEVGGIVSWQHALDYFHQTGVVFHRADLFSDCIVLDQDWALDAIYTVFHRGRVVPLLRDHGRFTRADLALIAWQDHSAAEQELFLGLMASCGICFRCGEAAAGEPRYVAPDLLPGFAAVAGRLHAWREEAATATLRLEHRFFHHAIIRDLMCAIGREAGDRGEYWRYGFWFKDGASDSQAVVQLEDTATPEAPGAAALVLKAQGRDPLRLLRELRRQALRRQIGGAPEELLTLEGTTVARGALDAAIDGQVLDVHRRPVPAAPFAAFFAERVGASAEPLSQEDPSMAAMRPVIPTAADKPPEVFISYAWGDDTPAGRLRDQAVERLEAALAGDGLRPVRDRDQIRSGERISAFIRRLTHADLVVAVISDEYLRSPYCMYEIYRIWQRCQGDTGELAQHVIPVIFPEVKIGSSEERAAYVEYWSQQAAELAALARRADPALSPESWKEVRLVRELAHHVDEILRFLYDVLMPRNLNADLSDDFQAVRDAARLAQTVPSSAAGSPFKDRARVFISYRHADRNVADQLYALLVKRSVSVWYDPLIPHGTDWREAIVENLSAARVMVILLSPAAFESDELKKELAVAVQEGVPLLAVRLQELKPPGAFAYELARSQWFDLFADPAARLAVLADLLEKIAREPRDDDPAATARPRQQRWRRMVGRSAGRFTGNYPLLVALLVFVSILVFLSYEWTVKPLEQLTAGGVVAPWRAVFYVVIVSSAGSPILLFSMLLRGVRIADLPLLAATAANTVILILLAGNRLAWLRLRLRLLAARSSR